MNKAHLRILASDVQKTYQNFLSSVENTNTFGRPLSEVQKKEVFVFIVDAYVSALSIPQYRTSDYQNVMNTFFELVMSTDSIEQQVKQYFSEQIEDRTSDYSTALQGSDPMLNLSNQLIKNIVESEGGSYDSNEYSKQIVALSILVSTSLMKITQLAKLFYESEHEKSRDDEIVSPFGKFMLTIITLAVIISFFARLYNN